MDRRNRSSLVLGALLILLGLWFFALQLFPALGAWWDTANAWPVYIIALGGVLLIAGLLGGVPSMAIPASIVAGIGGILYWQNLTDNFESWAYAWTLIPGFVGVGTILAALFGGETRRGLTGGAWLILISLVLFATFGSFLGGPNLLGAYWPVLLIALGVLLLLQSFFRRR